MEIKNKKKRHEKKTKMFGQKILCNQKQIKLDIIKNKGTFDEDIFGRFKSQVKKC